MSILLLSIYRWATLSAPYYFCTLVFSSSGALLTRRAMERAAPLFMQRREICIATLGVKVLLNTSGPC